MHRRTRVWNSAVVGILALCLATVAQGGITWSTVNSTTTLGDAVVNDLSTSLVSDGTSVYMYISSTGEIYKSGDPTSADTWTLLTTAPGILGDDWWVFENSGGMGYAPSLGASGSLIVYRSVAEQDGLQVYDLQSGTWSSHLNQWMGFNGYTVIGDYLYGISHANMVNNGGPITRADLFDLNATWAQHASIAPSIVGATNSWFSRVAQTAEVGGLLYGIKNDWSAPGDATDGNRLWVLDPADYVANFYDEVEGWGNEFTPATDLGSLPLDPGYGSAVVGLPANWSGEIGIDGGLFIYYGNTPTDLEGWGDQNVSPAYTLYDIATGTHTLGALPDVGGYGTAAVLHDGQLIVKQGDDTSGYDNVVFVGTPNANLPDCSTVTTLNVSAELEGGAPFSLVDIGLTPTDCNGDGDLTTAPTPVARSYPTGATIIATAPNLVDPAFTFVEWQVNGSPVAGNPAAITLSGASMTLVAVYKDECDPSNTFQLLITAEDIDGVELNPTIGLSFVECTSGSYNVVADSGSVFNFPLDLPITFTAPGTIPGPDGLNTFSHWLAMGEEIEGLSLTSTINELGIITAVYDLPAPPFEDGPLSYETVPGPVTSSPNMSLATDGATIFFMNNNTGQLFSTVDAYSWTPLATAPGTHPGESASLAYYGGEGTEGILLTLRDVPSAGDLTPLSSQVLCSYDIATDTWTPRGQRSHGTHGFAVVGDYLYAVQNASALNRGGPITRADLLNLDAYVTDHTAIEASISGDNFNWFGRVAKLANVNGLIYGIKNDWATNPRGTGDRLYRFDPADFAANTWTGNQNDPNSGLLEPHWTQDQMTPAVDLALLPVEPGRGSSITALPANWTQGIGADGGLMITVGRSPANNEGDGGVATDQVILYDIATGNFNVYRLPAGSSAGMCATFCPALGGGEGRVIIKRGESDEKANHDDIWIVAPRTFDPCANPIVVDVEADVPGEGPLAADILYSPTDCDGLNSGTTPFAMNAPEGSVITLSAAGCLPGYTFVRWLDDGVEIGTQPELQIAAASVVGTLTAEYEVPEPWVSASTLTYTYSTPADGSFGMAMASDDTYVYYLVRNSGEFWRTDANCRWERLSSPNTLPNIDTGGTSGNSSWYMNIIDYAAGLGSEGSIIGSYNNTAEGWRMLVIYDIATDTWSWDEFRGLGTNGGLVVGNYYYNVNHAIGGNLGGAFGRADLTALGSDYCERSMPAEADIEGPEDWRYTRVADLTEGADGAIYGIKNDGDVNSTTGERLFRFDPNNWIGNFYVVENSAWTSEARIITTDDLGELPWEVGYNAAVVGLPANWSSDVGADGGLFIMRGRGQGSDFEGWGTATSDFALYDIETATYALGSLPGLAGSGTTAAYHAANDAVYIKQGSNTTSDWNHNDTLWIMYGAEISPCDMPHNVDVEAWLGAPGSGTELNLLVTATPPDCNGDGNGTTPFVRSVGDGTGASYTAPDNSRLYRFIEWRIDGTPATTDLTVTLPSVTVDTSVQAVYDLRCASPEIVSVSAWDDMGEITDLTVNFNPADCDGFTGGMTPFSTNVGIGQTVTYVAPTCLPGYRFEKWTNGGGADLSFDAAYTVVVNGPITLEAHYVPDTAFDYTVGSLTFGRAYTPVQGKWATAMASDGTYLYYMFNRDGNGFFRTMDGCTWEPLDHPASPFALGGQGSEGYGSTLAYVDVGPQGSLVARWSDTANDQAARYDIATGKWQQLGQRAIGSHAFVGAGQYAFSISHAVGPNQGGPICRVDANPTGELPWACERTNVNNAWEDLFPGDWFMSRASNMTLGTDGLIYGFKNDGTTPPPDPSGDRFFVFDPADFLPTVWTGNPGDPLWQLWDPNPGTQTPATDLGALPFEPGAFACLTSVPSGWTSEIGADGGLMIIRARGDGADLEGWAGSTDDFVLYDVASASYVDFGGSPIAALPTVTGSGTSIARVGDTVYVKRGGGASNPDADLNDDLWVVTGAGGPQLCYGDTNCDGVVDFADINPFVAALSGQASYEAQYPGCVWLNADANEDGTVAFDDINPFVAILSSNKTCPPYDN